MRITRHLNRVTICASTALFISFAALAQSGAISDQDTQAEFDKALSWINEAPKLGNPPQVAFYLMQEAAKKENPLALAWLKKEAKNNSTGALISLGYYYGSKNDGANAVANFKRAADLGSKDALSVIASIYSEGWYGISKNEKLGCEWSKKSAEAGNYRDAVEYGLCVLLPIAGINRDLDEACRWGEVGANGMKSELKAAEEMVSNNKNMKSLDKSEWMVGLKNSTGRAYALFATCLNDNSKLRHRLTEAADLFKKSYELGFKYSGFLYGEMLENGRGVIQDYEEAFVWYKKAAENGMPAAQNRLGTKYAEGKGVGKNLVEALKWFIIASANGDDRALV